MRMRFPQQNKGRVQVLKFQYTLLVLRLSNRSWTTITGNSRSVKTMWEKLILYLNLNVGIRGPILYSLETDKITIIYSLVLIYNTGYIVGHLA